MDISPKTAAAYPELELVLWTIAGASVTGLAHEQIELAAEPPVRATLLQHAIGALTMPHDLPEGSTLADRGQHKRVIKALSTGRAPTSALPEVWMEQSELNDEDVVMAAGHYLRAIGSQLKPPVLPEITEPSPELPPATNAAAEDSDFLAAALFAEPTPGAQPETEPDPTSSAPSPEYLVDMGVDQLALAVAEGNTKAFEEFMRRFRGKLGGFAYNRMVGSISNNQVDEAIGDTLYAAYIAMRQGRFIPENDEHAVKWLFGVAGRKAVDTFRVVDRVRAHESSVDEIPEWGYSPFESDGDTELLDKKREVMRQLLDELKPKQRQIVDLYFAQDHTANKVAETLGSTPGTVRVNAHRILASLRQKAERRMSEPDPAKAEAPEKASFVDSQVPGTPAAEISSDTPEATVLSDQDMLDIIRSDKQQPGYQERRAAAYKCLFQKHEAALLRYALRISRNEALAQDAVQETFFRTIRAVEGDRTVDWTTRGGAATWLFTVTKHVLFDHFKSSAATNEVPIVGDTIPLVTGKQDHDPSTEQQVFMGVEATAVHEAMTQLSRDSPRQAEVLQLFYFQDVSWAEVAQKMGLKENTAKSLGLRAIRHLVDYLPANYSHSDPDITALDIFDKNQARDARYAAIRVARKRTATDVPAQGDQESIEDTGTAAETRAS